VDDNLSKVEALVYWARRLDLGVVVKWETRTIGAEVRVSSDELGEKWSLHSGGNAKCHVHGMEFLVGQELEVISFNPLSSRVSLLHKAFRKVAGSAHQPAVASACFVNVYAPTQMGASAADVVDFYADLVQALADIRKAGKCNDVMVLGGNM
jgi:hypothetical protein